MNNERRKWLSNIVTKLHELKDEVDEVMGEEQDAFDNLPESIQMSEKGDLMEENINDLQTAMDSVDEATQTIDEVTVRG